MVTTLKANLAVFAALAGGLACSPAQANLLINGDFNLGIPTHPGWVVQNNVFHRGTSEPAFAGFWFGAGTHAENGPGIIAFNAGDTPANANNTISQTFGTVFGETYQVEYDFGVTENSTQQLRASIFGDDGTTVLFTQLVSDTNTSATTNSLQHFSFSFVADGDQATIRFIDVLGNRTVSTDGVLDNVSVTGLAPLPEPVTLALLGVGLAGLALGRRHRRLQN